MFGLRVNNEDGIIQIDSQYSNYEILSKGFTNERRGVIDFGGSGDHLLFVRPRTNSNHIGRGRISDVTRTFDYESGADDGWTWQNLPPAPNWQGIDYLVVRPAYATSPRRSGFGLQVMDKSGRAVFDSERDYLKITAVHRSSVSGGTEDIALPSPSPSKRHYVCTLPLYFTEAVQSTTGDEDYYGFTAGFASETLLRIRKRQCVYTWEGVVGSPGRSWHIGDDHRPFFIVAEY